jgi:hypothetical protein
MILGFWLLFEGASIFWAPFEFMFSSEDFMQP